MGAMAGRVETFGAFAENNDRLLDAADMGVVATDPDGIRRCTSLKPRKAHKPYIARHKNFAQGRFQMTIEIKPSTPTWIDVGDWSVPMQHAFYYHSQSAPGDRCSAGPGVCGPGRCRSALFGLVRGCLSYP